MKLQQELLVSASEKAVLEAELTDILAKNTALSEEKLHLVILFFMIFSTYWNFQVAALSAANDSEQTVKAELQNFIKESHAREVMFERRWQQETTNSSLLETTNSSLQQQVY